jgi:imidazoleglycerol-phosphate dehydratase / histidinol-phosphatase
MQTTKRVLFIDRDGTLIKEAPPTYQLDSFSKLAFYPDMFKYMRKIAEELDYELVMVTNQDGLGTHKFKMEDFEPVHKMVMDSLGSENIHFEKVFIDKSYPEENLPTRKPGIGMLLEYLNNTEYDIANSFVIGDRITDMQLAKNLNCKGFWLNIDSNLGAAEIEDKIEVLRNDTIVVESPHWKDIYTYLKRINRKVFHVRNTNETKIYIGLNLEGSGEGLVTTGIGFFDHMLQQVSKHANLDLDITCKGDLHIDEHHTIEDVGIALGESFTKALGNKVGIERYGFVLPMDDCLAHVAIDFGGRNWLVWEVDFKREKIGEMPTEMFFHFFKSFSDAAKCNLNIKATGENEHHKIEAIFKAFAKAIKMAVARDLNISNVPSTKGLL